MIVIPSLEILGGRVVATDGDAELVCDPLVAARALRDDGALFFHIVDLDAIRGTGDNIAVARRLVDAGLPCQFAGGVRTVERATALIDSGVDRIVVGSVLHRAPDVALEMASRFGQRALAAIDVGGGLVGVSGAGGVDATPLSEALAQIAKIGFRGVLVTSFVDGAPRVGPDLAMLRDALGHAAIEVHANVLATDREQLREVRELFDLGLAGVVVANACRVLEVAVG